MKKKNREREIEKGQTERGRLKKGHIVGKIEEGNRARFQVDISRGREG